ncbi:MAG: sugar phosphate nucleotidyltransferase [Halobacteria archaeon]
MPPPAVVLAAGEGTRVRPFTTTEPKVMLPVANRPILEHVLLALRGAGVREIALIVGYKHERVRDAIGDGRKLGVRVSYVLQKQQLGTAHALKAARAHVQGPTLVLNGDNLVEAEALRDLLRKPEGEMSILAIRREGASRRSLVVEGGRVRKIRPGGTTHEGEPVNTGVYLVTPAIFKHIGALDLSYRGEYELIDAIERAIDRGADVRARVTGHGWHEIVTPWDLLRVNGLVLDREAAGWTRGGRAPRGVEPGAHLQGPVAVGPGSRIRAGSTILGPVLIGANCDIGPHAALLPGTSVGDGCRVGPFAHLRNSILMEEVEVEAHAHMVNSVAGRHARIGPGVHLESGRATVGAEGAPREAELGALVGEGASVGDRALVAAGRVLGVRSRVGAGAVVRQDVPDGALVL